MVNNVEQIQTELNLIQSLSKIGSWRFNLKTYKITCSFEISKILETPKKDLEITYSDWLEIIYKSDRIACDSAFKNALKNLSFCDIEYRITTFEGNIKWVRTRIDFAIKDNNTIFGTVQDITSLKEHEESLHRMSSIFLQSKEGSAITDVDGIILDVNDAFTHVTGYLPEEVIGKNPRILQSGIQDEEFYKNMWNQILTVGSWSGEIWNKNKEGKIYPEHLKIYSIKNAEGEITNFISLFSDISETKRRQEQIHYLAYHDALTGLPNRVKMSENLELAIKDADRYENSVMLAFLDLDGFKAVNDKFGHYTGDKLLKHVAHSIQKYIRGNDMCARIGGDEFVILLNHIEDEQEAHKALQRIINEFQKPTIIDDLTLEISASIGVTMYPLDKSSPDTLLRHADQAMYLAKQLGKNRIKHFDAALQRIDDAHNKIRDEIRIGLDKNQFELNWQPYYDMFTNNIVGAEVLIRWRNDNGEELLYPEYFIGAIQDDILSIELGDFVIEHSLETLSKLTELGLNLDISINLFPRQLLSAHFESKVIELLKKYPNVNPSQITFEILETTAVDDFDNINGMISRFNFIGIKFAIDDFGIGYSSLTYFSKIHAHVVKIDKSFVSKVHEKGTDYAIINSIFSLCKNFKKKIIVEGIETNEQKELLLEMGCTIGQGFLFSKPLPFDELVKLLISSLPTSNGNHL